MKQWLAAAEERLAVAEERLESWENRAEKQVFVHVAVQVAV